MNEKLSNKFSFNNDLIHGVYASQYIISWVHNGMTFKTRVRNGEIIENHWARFIDWLKWIEVNGSKLTDEEIQRITYLAGGGKFELEESIKHYLATTEPIVWNRKEES